MTKNYFSDDELKCKHCGKLVFDEDFRAILNRIRERCGVPLPVSSGYRCPDHPVEARKATKSGAHTTGKAADIAVSGALALEVVHHALDLGIQRIGVNQKGAHSSRFIHLDMVTDASLPSPMIWSY